MSSEITLTDWIFFLLQVALSVGGIWLGIYLYLRQQQETQNERYGSINKNIERINNQIKELSAEIQETRHHLSSETSNIKMEISLIEKTTSHIQSQIWLSHDKIVDKVVTQFINERLPVKLTQYAGLKLPENLPSQETIEEHVPEEGE